MEALSRELSVGDLRALDLKKLLDGAQMHECRSFALRLLEHARAERGAGREPSPAVTLLTLVLGFSFDPGESKDPFRTHSWFADIGPDDIAPSNYHALEEWLPEVEDPEVAARVADLLWTTRRGRKPAHEHGREAVKKYLAAAEALSEDHLNWPLLRDRLKRAMVLALKFDKDAPLADAMEALLRQQGDAPVHRTAVLMELILEYDAERAAAWLPKARKLAELAEAEGSAGSWGAPGFGIARRYWEIITRYCDLAHRTEEDDTQKIADMRRDAGVRVARTSILEADKARDATSQCRKRTSSKRRSENSARAGRPNRWKR